MRQIDSVFTKYPFFGNRQIAAYLPRKGYHAGRHPLPERSLLENHERGGHIMSDRKKIRCAIYTRKSSEEGLNQDFNSLDAQREACEAYIASQKAEGWLALPKFYDDGGISGGTLKPKMNSRRVRDIDYQLLPGSDRKTTDIVIERNGDVVVLPPNGISPEQIDAVVESKRIWIYRNLAEWRDLNSTAVVREWINGETFLYLGRSYRLSLIYTQQDSLKLKEGRFCLKRSLIEKTGTCAARKAFEDYYTAKGLQRIKNRVRFFCA